MTPFGDRVIMEIVKEERASGIIVAESAQKETDKGKVIAVGPDATLSVGDIVLFNRYSVESVTLDEKVLLVARECELIAKL